MHRCITPYDPLADAEERWPDWDLLLSPLGRITAVYSSREKTIIPAAGKRYGV
jgi:hypothetical protein